VESKGIESEDNATLGASENKIESFKLLQNNTEINALK
jgi:hypothetical protein